MAGSMFLEKVKSKGLAHISYILGHGSQAAVIDPRRDCQIYVDIAHQRGAKITHIFETHRNEDYVVGSMDLARRTGARIYHGKNLDFAYGNPVSEGDIFELGGIRLTILETPGHTPESLSIVLADKSFGDKPIAVFTGDCLFIGSVGRTDLFPGGGREGAGLQYDSIFGKILPLGDQVILYPAHGAGSVCGSGMADREFSTLGYERTLNPSLQVEDRDTFIERKISGHEAQPPYFKRMEEVNQYGSAPAGLPDLQPMTPGEFEAAMQQGALAIDLRSPEAFAGAFIPGSLAIPLEMVPAFAGFFVPYEKDIILIVNSYDEAETAVRYFMRLGFDRLAGYLADGLHGWEVSARRYDRIPAVHVRELVRRINERENFTILDVRGISEVKETGKLPGATHIFLGELPSQIGKVPKDKPVTTFCGSGQRAIIAASILKQHGFDTVEDSLGSMEACIAAGCPVVPCHAP